MKTLYLLRHANALDAAPVAMGDHERALSEKGEAEAAAAAEFLAHYPLPGFVLSSTSLRTIQTVRIIYAKLLKDEGDKAASRFDRVLYLAPANVLLDNIAQTDDSTDTLMVVAHNPGVAELAQALSHGTFSDHAQDFPTATVAVFRADVGSWRDIASADVKLEKVFTP